MYCRQATGLGFLQQLQRFLVVVAAKELLQHSLENGIGVVESGKQGHGRLELDIIGATEYLGCIGTGQIQQGLAYSHQPRP